MDRYESGINLSCNSQQEIKQAYFQKMLTFNHPATGRPMLTVFFIYLINSGSQPPTCSAKTSCTHTQIIEPPWIEKHQINQMQVSRHITGELP